MAHKSCSIRWYSVVDTARVCIDTPGDVADLPEAQGTNESHGCMHRSHAMMTQDDSTLGWVQGVI
jgi:hypothetical protein